MVWQQRWAPRARGTGGELTGVETRGALVPPAQDTAAPLPRPGQTPAPLALLDRFGAWLALAGCALLVALVYGQALRFAFTFDDPLDLPRAEGRSVWSMFSTSEGYAYYRPIPFVIWKGLHALQGRYSQATLHGLTLVAHILSAWFLYLLLRRLTGNHWGLLASVLFIVYPFSYQVVFGAHTLFHPLMTAAILACLILYLDARRCHDPRRLAGSLVAAVIALWTHESGVVLLPLIVGLELFHLVQTGSRRPSWWPALHAVATGLFLLVWYIVPKWPRKDVWTSASLLPNARYFLQGVIYPVAAQLKGLGQRFGFDPVRALWPAIVVTLLALVALYVVGRRPWTPLLALAATGVILFPAWLILTWAYVEDAPRLLYPAAPAIAALWGLLPSLHFRQRAITWGWRVVSLVLLLALTVQSITFINLRRDMWAQGTVMIERIADTASAHGTQPLLFLNVPAWFAPKQPEYPVGHVGLTALPGYVGLGQSVYLHRGVHAQIESRGYYPDLNGWKYDFNTHGGPATIEQFGALLRRVTDVYRVDMLATGPRVVELGALTPNGVKTPPTGPRFGPGYTLISATATLNGTALDARLDWAVTAPPPGDVLPVLAVRDGSGAIVARTTGYPIGGIAAPRLWQPGDLVRDQPVLALPGNLPSGTYTIWLWWEDRTTHQPLPGAAANGQPLGPAGLALGSFTQP